MFLLRKKLGDEAVDGLALVAVHLMVEITQGFFRCESKMNLLKVQFFVGLEAAILQLLQNALFLTPLLPWTPIIAELVIIKMVLQDCFGCSHKEWEGLGVVHVDEIGKIPFHPLGVIAYTCAL